MAASNPARRIQLLLPWLVLGSALTLAGCGSQPSDELENKLARAEAAATRAETAQKAAEAAAKRAENDMNSAANADVDTASNQPEETTQNEPAADPNANQSSPDN